MKKIINGKLYNTETAEKLAEFYTNCTASDFRYLEESLYRKRTGEYFLSGFGGPMTRYAIKLENGGSRSGYAIRPLTEEEAREWAEDRITADQYIAIFGDVEE